jgi:hypothetical protein
MLEMVWYTQVLPTAIGNGIDPFATNEFAVALGVAGASPADPAGLAAPLAALPAGALAAGPDVLADAHPASATTAAPARTARADLNMLM